MSGRLVWVVWGGEGFGVRRATLEKGNALRKRGCVVHFVALCEGPFTDDLRQSNFEVAVLTSRGAGGAAAGSSSLAVHVWGAVSQQCRIYSVFFNHVRTLKPQWIHLRNNQLLPLVGLVARELCIPVYWHLPNTINRKLPFHLQAIGYQCFCRWCGILPLGNSRHTAESLGSKFVKTGVLRLGVDINHFSPEAGFKRLTRNEYGLAPDIPIFAIIARVVPEKAQDRVLDAVIGLLELGVLLQLVIVGGPNDSLYYKRLRTRVTSAGVGGFIKLVSSVADPRPWFDLADVIINSRLDAEPFGLTIIEAMLMTRPVLAYREGGPNETIIDSKTGWLIDDPSVASYQLGICRALRDQARWGEMGQVARRHSIKHFAIEVVVSDYLGITASHRKSLPRPIL